MVRKLAPQVPQAVARLLRAQTIPEPVWYKPVMSNPPSPLPPRQLVNRQSAHDLPSNTAHTGSADHSRTRKLKHAKTPKLRIQPIVYEQRDQIRKRFLEDFPFEALRPVSLVEGRELSLGGKVEGAEWTELRQRGENPTVEEWVHQLHPRSSSSS
jgi:small subunit ribosomal protein S23